MSCISSTNSQPQANQYLIQGDYDKAVALYEQAIALDPTGRANYWHLGLMLLLQGQEEEAQVTWMSAILDGEPEQIPLWTTELFEVLQAEAERREANSEYQTAWAIRQHMREMAPEKLNNLLRIIQISLDLKTYTTEDLAALKLVQVIQTFQPDEIDFNLLLNVLENVLEYDPCHPLAVELAEACLFYSGENSKILDVVLVTSETNYRNFNPDLATRLALSCLRFNPDNLEVLYSLSIYQQYARQYTEAIETSKRYYALSQTLIEKVQGSYLILSSLMRSGGYWQEACSIFENYKSLLMLLLKEKPTNLDGHFVLNLLVSCFFFSHLNDNRSSNRQLQNQVAHICQINIQNFARKSIEKYIRRSSIKNRKLKVGYLSNCLRHHSVGWLSRWLFKYHNREKFDIYTYITQTKNDDSIQQWIVQSSSQAWDVSALDGTQIADRIYEDEIDILIDLDSVTSARGCEVMALKPAPVQVTWLGLDASGLPAIDYFIADPYVLPESAQADYTETIWRLPQTYIAVDGFEVAVPRLRRDQLDIPNDAVVYLSSQISFKRHPNTVRLQMQIIKQVPNSYFLIKGLADQNAVKQFFEQIAAEEGVTGDRLRFLPTVFSEVIHRANLSIADVVLDTYPYNGATTTLETLWMGIPLVTRVGEQFAARNSYAMMMNVGVTEGIAWTDEEYVEWGVRLGKDPTLRQKITWQLQQSRQTSPLWNAQQFTREMERAYEQMWARYVETHCG